MAGTLCSVFYHSLICNHPSFSSIISLWLFICRWGSGDEVVLTFNLKPWPLCVWSPGCSTKARSEIKIFWMPQQGGEERGGEQCREDMQLLMLDKCEMPTVAFHALLRDQPNEALLSPPFILLQAHSSLSSQCSRHLLNSLIYQIVSPHF